MASALRDGNDSVSAHHDRHIRYRASDLKTVAVSAKALPIQKATMSEQLDQQCVNTIRFLSVDMVQKADSGHPGLPLDAAPMAYVLWTRFIKYNPRNPDWVNRDRFVLSAGHGSALLYSLLYLSGYALSLDDIRQFRQWAARHRGIRNEDTPRAWKSQPARWGRAWRMPSAWTWQKRNSPRATTA